MIEQVQDDIVVIADNPAEMVESQKAIIQSVVTKLDSAQQELEDNNRTLESLMAAGMKYDAADRMVKRSESRVLFLEKTVEALRAGYVIVPAMPNDVVAIRVKRAPRHQYKAASYTPTINEADPEALPVGEGKYVHPLPPTYIDRGEVTDASSGNKRTEITRWTTGKWNEEIGLPVEFLRPTIVERTGKCMMRRLFDEIAVVGASSAYVGKRRRDADPMVVGSVFDKVAKRRVWFLVAWFVDTRDL